MDNIDDRIDTLIRDQLVSLIQQNVARIKRTTIKFTGAELGWTLEDNDAVNHTIEAVGGRHYKTYRVYDKPLTTGC
jgi:hypothetical protein